MHVDGDPTRLGQVISNLLTNAAKYTPPDGDIWVQARQADGQLQVSVRDSGIGIAPEMVPHIFELFVQERQAAARSQGGLGIGLTIVRSLAELHGGSVSVRSDGVGTGSEFIVRLPAVAPELRARCTRSRSNQTIDRAAHPPLWRESWSWTITKTPRVFSATC